MTQAVQPAAAGTWSPALTQAVVGLGVTQIIAWGSIYYALAVIGPSITRDFGWQPQWTYVGFSVALVVAGIASPFAGRAIDSLGGRLVMSAGSVVAAIGLALLAASQGWWSYLLAWAVLGIAKSMVLYEAAFATLTQVSVARARRAITYLSFFGGLASTFSWPITRALHDAIGWRETMLVYAGLALAVCLPIHAWALPSRAALDALEAAGSEAMPGASGAELSPRFLALAALLLASTFAMTSFMWSGISVHLLSMLGLLGFSSAAGVAIGALIGPAQVLGRVGDMLFGARFHPLQVMQVSSSLLPAAFLLLFLGGGAGWAAVPFAVLYGVSIGMNTIARGTVPLALFGPKGYGARLGRLAAPAFIAESIAPVAYAFVIAWHGAWAGLAVAAIASGFAWVGVMVLTAAWRSRGA